MALYVWLPFLILYSVIELELGKNQTSQKNLPVFSFVLPSFLLPLSALLPLLVGQAPRPPLLAALLHLPRLLQRPLPRVLPALSLCRHHGVSRALGQQQAGQARLQVQLGGTGLDAAQNVHIALVYTLTRLLVTISLCCATCP